MVVVTERRDAPADTELSERLAPLRRALQHHVAAGVTDGLVTLVDDGSGHPVVDRYGTSGTEPAGTAGTEPISSAVTLPSNTPAAEPAGTTGTELMGRHTRVPIGEVTTTFTAATVLLLVEDGAIDLHDPIDHLLPELAGRPVLRAIGAPLDDTVPAIRSVTLVDLLASRSGFGVGPASAPGTPVHRAARSLGLGVFDPDEASSPELGVDDWLERLGTLPLLHQPGERRLGRTDALLLGALVERVTGKPLPEVMADRVLTPLHLHHTSFRAPGDRADVAAPRMADAAAGLTSTVDDVWRFAAMLVDGGRGGDATRLLAASTVRTMLVDHARSGHPDQIESHERGWGLGVEAAAVGLQSARASDGFGMDDVGVTWRSNAETGATAVMLTLPGIDALRAPQLVTAFWNGVDRAGV
ncbi:MAG: beta-lactamase family protein [Actinomycetota bacterium]|nr:beta-lactamase family protein [Actinomycetota bacterium]